MKRSKLIKELEKKGCILLRHGKRHDEVVELYPFFRFYANVILPGRNINTAV